MLKNPTNENKGGFICLTLFTMSRAYRPQMPGQTEIRSNLPRPLLKKCETWKLAVKLGRVPKEGLNIITLKPENPSQELVDALKQSSKYSL